MTVDMGTTGSFTVLAVCTANRYRSPLGEHLLRAAAVEHALDWQVRSAGTLAVRGDPIDPRTQAALVARGVEPAVLSQWRSQRLDAELVADADLILAADSRHRAAVAMIDPRARARTFLLLQFARLAGDAAADQPRTGRELIEAVRCAQGRGQPPAAGADELADPAADPDLLLPASAERVAAAVRAIVTAAAGG
jgi:protein-tyrosine-phosphatase